MKYLFAAIAAILALASLGTYWSMPASRSMIPVIYWVTDANPARDQQINLCHRWQVKQGYSQTYTLESAAGVADLHTVLTAAVRDDIAVMRPELCSVLLTDDEFEAFKQTEGWVWIDDAVKQRLTEAREASVAYPVSFEVPACEMRTDSANRDQAKQVIQGVSGVGGDVMDMWKGGGMRYFRDIGIIEDITKDAEAMGFDANQTYDAILNEITVIDDRGRRRQYQFPCNVPCVQVWVNKATFERYGQPIPPRRWTFEQFEAAGKAFVEAANPPGGNNKVFFCADVPTELMHRSMGISKLNETMTAPNFNHPAIVEALRLKYKWTHVDRILPSASDRSSFDTASGYGGAMLQLFNRGNYAMFFGGRFHLIQLRRFPAMDLALVEPPHGGFPVTSTGTRAAAIYVAGDHKLHAKRFLAYLASEDYNMQIVLDADAMPPNPAYTRTEAFLHPPDFPNEWGLHEQFLEALDTIAIGGVYSPYVLDSEIGRYFHKMEDEVLSNVLSPEVSAAKYDAVIRDEIQRTLNEIPGLRERYEKEVALQAEIDERRAAGRPVPRAWVLNPFYQRYYEKMGWFEDQADGTSDTTAAANANQAVAAQ